MNYGCIATGPVLLISEVPMAPSLAIAGATTTGAR